MLASVVRKGKLTVIDADAKTHVFGEGRDGPDITMRLHDRSLYWKLVINPELYAAEAYMDGTMTFGKGETIRDFLWLFSINRKGLYGSLWQRILQRLLRYLRWLHQFNPVRRSATNAQHHYDLGEKLYRLFLDENMNYSCAYFRDPEHETLEQAQDNKLRLIARKLKIEPGMRIAEIGSGWGSLAIHLVRNDDVNVTAINVATDQLATSRRRAEEAGIADRITFLEKDYRDLQGSFDRVVSVGMMEHVGAPHFDAYFGKVRDLLEPEGFALIHAIGTNIPPGATSPFIRKYIFPGGYTPAMSDVFGSLERCGLWVADTEFLRLHYAWTIDHWRQRFEKNRNSARALYDERFCRMWEFYLNAVELGFRHGSSMVFQLLLSRVRDAVPVWRDYMLEGDQPPARPVSRPSVLRRSA
jgi:cyclopropane-fatty-acyl-phospholipid synthase